MMISNTNTDINLSEVFAPSYHDWYRVAKTDKYLKHVLKGGRGSAKSTHIALKFVLDIIKYPVTGICIRKVGNTLQESCYEQLKEAIDILDLNHCFKFNLSPLRITYISRGNTIIFRGADDPAKIKSIKMSKFPISILWLEELGEFNTEDEVRVIENSILRAELDDGLKYKFYYSYNPPKRKQSWVNKLYESNFVNPNTHIFHTTYLDNPYISKAFIEEAEHIKKTNLKRYEWEYLGKAVGSGVVPFDNLTFREITDDEVSTFDNIQQGLDWGYANDPLSFTRSYYDKTRRKLYVYGEVYGVKISNRRLVEIIKSKGWDDCIITADSAEPKSIDECWDLGLRIYGAKKGPGSVEYGEKWLDDLEEIIIDPIRCPNTTREFESIDYQVDKDGNQKAKLEDKDNHSIDALRYGCEDEMKGQTFSFD